MRALLVRARIAFPYNLLARTKNSLRYVLVRIALNPRGSYAEQKHILSGLVCGSYFEGTARVYIMATHESMLVKPICI